MSVSLTKGAKVSLTKAIPGLRHVRIGLGWDLPNHGGDYFDLDASVFLVSQTGRVRRDEDFVFYNNLRSPCGAVLHQGDNRTGAGEGDDESIQVRLDKLPPDVNRVVVAVTIHEAEARRQSFAQVTNAYVRLVELGRDREVARFDLTAGGVRESAMVFGELIREVDDWSFRAVGEGMYGGLRSLAEIHGVKVA
ncbi:MAG: terE [Cyanobacteria bacterium RYN_339]|nr:terE [Cyanobacteria bacterium RYN_339]